MSTFDSRKRSRAAASSLDADTLMVIKTAEGEPLAADALTVRTFSTCARELPADAAEWDVSGLLYSEQQEPFAHATVACWLACIRSTIHGAAELDADDKAQLSTAKGLHAVLSFAHAVDSRTSVCNAACSQLGSLMFVVQLQEQQTVELELSCKGGYLFKREDDSLCLWLEGSTEPISQPLTDQDRQQCRQQVAEQTGALLHMAHVLKLQPLVDALHSFIFRNSKHYSILYGVLELVFTQETLDTALGSGTVSKEAYVNSVLSRPCSFVEGEYGYAGLLRPCSPFTHDEDTGEQQFEAVVLQSFSMWRPGDRVNVSLNVLGGEGSATGMTLTEGQNEVWLPAQLLLGYTVVDDDDWAQYMSGTLPQT